MVCQNADSVIYRKVGIYLKKDKLNKIITNHLNKVCQQYDL